MIFSVYDRNRTHVILNLNFIEIELLANLNKHTMDVVGLEICRLNGKVNNSVDFTVCVIMKPGHVESES